MFYLPFGKAKAGDFTSLFKSGATEVSLSGALPHGVKPLICWRPPGIGHNRAF
jgi:hypothetical protein